MADQHLANDLVADPNEIYFNSLSDLTRVALRDWLNRIGRDDLADRGWWDFNEFCGLYWRLRHQPDNADLFPRGKWATLQRMETLIAEALPALQEVKP